MNAFSFYAVAFDCEVRCIDCLPDRVSVDDEYVHPIFANSEWDYVPICDVCGCVHDYVIVLRHEKDGATCPRV